jgi:hypothetical protein
MNEHQRIIQIASGIMSSNPSPIVRFHLLHKVIGLPLDNIEIKKAKDLISESKWVVELTSEQRDDGSWGRLHSRDTKSNQKIPTTEWAIDRALSLGLDNSHPALQRAVDYLTTVLETGECHDPPEKNDRWSTGVKLFAGASLAKITPHHPSLEDVTQLWKKIIQGTFHSNRYDPEVESRIHKEITGATVKDSYLVTDNKYLVSLIGSVPQLLSGDLRTIYLKWLWHGQGRIGYLNAPLNHPPSIQKPTSLEHWFTSLELVSRIPGWKIFAKDAIEWIWQEQLADGHWDFGPLSRSKMSHMLPMADHWRRRMNRKIDWTTRILTLLAAYYSG